MKKCLLAILGLLFIVSCAQEPVTVPETMPNEVHLSYTFNSDINEFGGFGIQHTGTVSNGNRSNILELDCEYF